MTLTEDVKHELCRLSPAQTSARKAEVTAILRFAGGLHIASNRVLVEAHLDLLGAARRLQAEIRELYGHHAAITTSAHARNRKTAAQYLVRVAQNGDALARQTGLLDQRGRPVRGMPPQVVAGSVDDATGVWRGAFLAAGLLAEPGRSVSLEVVCPGPEAALALVGAARRMGVVAKAREVRGADRAVVKDADAIATLLARMGIRKTLETWQQRRAQREVRASANRLANFDDANLRRSARAAVAAAARVTRALEILGDDAPAHLAEAGRLRIAHGKVSLEELGQLADPPMTKDAIAGRIRRLLTIADRRARQEGLPGTHAAVTSDMLDL